MADAKRLIELSMVPELAKEVATQIDGAGGDAVESVNGQTGAVVLTADDVGALPDDYTPPAPTWASVTGKPTTFAPIIGTTSTTAMAGDTAIPTLSFATVSALTGDWRGEGSETLLAALTALQAGIAP